AALRPRPRQPVPGPVRALRLQCRPRRVRAQPSPGTEGLVADRRAAAGDARAGAARRRPRARDRHPDGRLLGAQARNVRVAGDDDGVADRSLAADVSHRHPAHPRLRRDAEVAAELRPRRGRGVRPMDDRHDDCRRLAPPDPAGDHARRLPAHADHAAGALGDARGAARRLHQVRACARAPRPRRLLSPRAEEHARAGDDDHGTADRRADRVRDHHGDRLPVAGHGPALHPGGAVRRHPGDGSLSVPDRADLRDHQPRRRSPLLRRRSEAARRAHEPRALIRCQEGNEPMKALAPWLLAATLSLAAPLSEAITLRVANQGDVQSMDPHSLNESLQLSFTGNVYESLVERGKDMGLTPTLATKWTQTSPTVWRFDLRPNVKFHDGTPFTADDVVFTFRRAAGEGSDMKGITNP